MEIFKETIKIWNIAFRLNANEPPDRVQKVTAREG